MKIQFETKGCGRCSGSGRYAYNPIDGSMCYGCKGSGERITANGERARKAYDEQIMDYLGVTADALIPGNVIKSKAWGGVMGNYSPMKNRMIEEVCVREDGQIGITFRGGMRYAYQPDDLVRLVDQRLAPVVNEIMISIAEKYKGATVRP